ncbi:MAG: dephospho-CoA kinase [Sphingobacteriales bacterium]|nr:MAG: dephospho-CoA kinase [Sphingobacteriales bacterium]
MLSVGITGGIGSGKTTVCKLFALLRVPVYNADEAAKILMQQDKMLIKKIKKLFGNDIYSEDNSLNRRQLAAIVFSDKSALEALEKVVHPAVMKHSEKWVKNQKTPYVLKESALLFESGSFKEMDKIIMVYASEYVRIKRVQKRDGSTTEEIKARIAKQLPDAYKISRSDFLVNNDGRLLLIPQVLDIHKQLLIDAENR